MTTVTRPDPERRLPEGSDPAGIAELGPEDRCKLLRFVCSLAWADLQVAPEERAFVIALARRLAIGDDERRRVDEYLQVPPRPEEVDPASVPIQHRDLFLRAARAVVQVDGKVAGVERDSLQLLEQLLR